MVHLRRDYTNNAHIPMLDVSILNILSISVSIYAKWMNYSLRLLSAYWYVTISNQIIKIT